MKLNNAYITAFLLATAWLYANDIQAQTNDTNIIRQVLVHKNGEIYDTLNLMPWDSLNLMWNQIHLEANPKKPVSHADFMDESTWLYNIDYHYWDRALEKIREHILIEINNIRGKNGKKRLVINPKLQNFAQKRAEYLYDNNLLEHWDWEEELGNRLHREWIYDFHTCWENIWQWQRNINSIVYSQVDSPEHFTALTDSIFTEIGIWIKYTRVDKNGNIIEDDNDTVNDGKLRVVRVINFAVKEQ